MLQHIRRVTGQRLDVLGVRWVNKHEHTPSVICLPISNITSGSSTLDMVTQKPEIGEKSRAPEFYGFVVWASTSLIFVLYILWALLPDSWIMALGINWYPNR